ncbi:hypothetical protein Tco_1498664 [Tanacetum coccineum]
MANLKFADTHNMVAFLSKPAENEGFEQILQALVDGKKIIITESIVRRDLQLEDAEGVDCLPNATIFVQLTLMGYEKISQKLTFYKAFFSPEWKFLIHTILQCLSSKTTAWNRKPTRKNTKAPRPSGSSEHVADEAVYKERGDSLATLNEPSSPRTSSGSGPRCQETIGDTIAQIRSENVSKFSNDSLLVGFNTPQSDEDRLKLNELMELCTKLQDRVLTLEKTKTAQGNEIKSLKRRVKKLERRNKSRTYKLKRLYKVGLSTRIVSSNEEDLGDEDTSKQGRKIT